jgi:hypothetical protein
MPGKEAIVARIPDCDIHKPEKVPAVYDARTYTGQWAFVCQEHFESHTEGALGTGYGQRLILKDNG